MVGWILLVLAGLVEIVMVFALKHSQGWTRLWPSVLGVAAALGSIFLLSHAARTLPMATAYAVWTGIGAVGVVLVGIVLLQESTSPARLVCLAAIFSGIAGLHLFEH